MNLSVPKGNLIITLDLETIHPIKVGTFVSVLQPQLGRLWNKTVAGNMKEGAREFHAQANRLAGERGMGEREMLTAFYARSARGPLLLNTGFNFFFL